MEKYTIEGCKEIEGSNVVRVPDSEAQFWTVYEGVLDLDTGLTLHYAVKDFPTREDAVHFLEML